MTEEFGPYRLEHLIGRGGMGEVHRAWDTRRGRTVALKRLPAPLAGDPEFQARFRRESALAAQLSEPHIIPIHDFGEINGRLFIDMRLVDGTDLASVVTSGGPMAPRRAVGILAQVAGLFVVFCLVVIVYGLTDASSTTTERVGGVAILLLLAGMAVACTVPMFTQPARRYVAARAGR
jgi:hypothetical protein